MFAGPNGSGKSTLKTFLPPQLLGVYVNPDDLEREVGETGYLDLLAYEVEAPAEELLVFLMEPEFIKSAGLLAACDSLRADGSRLYFDRGIINS